MIFDKVFRIGKGLIKIVPSGARNNLITIMNKIRLKRIEQIKTPTSIVFFITGRCNLRCKHCFYWKELNQKKTELNLNQIKKITNSFRNSYGILLTGGEPFLRTDFLDICKILNRKFKSVRVATNAFLPENIYNTVKDTLNQCKFSDFRVQISIDGPEEIHNKIRGLNSSFKNAIQTLKMLKKLEKDFKNFKVEVGITVSKVNYKHVEDLIKYLLRFRVPIDFLLTRGCNYGVYGLSKDISTQINPKEAVFISIKELESFYKNIVKLNDNSDYKFLTKYHQLLLEYSIYMLKNKKKIVKCYAGKVDGVIYEDGAVSLCELTKPIGNLAETNYDFYKLWNSKKANVMREKIRNCFCIHGCNLSTNIALDTKSIIRLLK